MRYYRDKGACGKPDEITIIEDENMVVVNQNGEKSPGFTYIDSHTIRAHPFIIDWLIESADPVWTLEEILEEV